MYGYQKEIAWLRSTNRKKKKLEQKQKMGEILNLPDEKRKKKRIVY